MCVNKKHKSSVFSTLFNSPDTLKELYSAIKDIDIPDNAIIDINTLSDAFIEKGDLISLELIVKIYNINQGRNPEILEKSKNLNEYSFFIDKIREYNKKLSLEESVKEAVKYCIEHDILRQYLQNHGSEIINMLFEEISIEEIVAVRSEEAREEGREYGLAEGLKTRNIEIARNLLTKGSTHEFIQEITGLSTEEIEKL